MKLLSMKLTNFKGIRQADFDFPDGGNYNIYGANATGKSTTFDALTWLLFDKDSLDTKDFTIKTLVDGEPLHHAEHSVEAAFLMESGQRITLKKVYKEKWQRPRGKLEPEFVGHTTDYYLNELASSASEYKKYISGIIDEKKFKVLTNPLYFNENLKDADRRAVLMDIIGGVDQDVIIAQNLAELKDLKPLLNGRSVEDFKQIVKQSLSKTKKEVDSIEPAIKEHQAMMIPGADAANMGLYQEQIKRCDGTQSYLLAEIAKIKAGTVSTELEEKKNELKQKIWQAKDADAKQNAELRETLLKKTEEAKRAVIDIESDIYGWNNIIKDAEDKIAFCANRREELVTQFSKIQSTTFDIKPVQTVCPTCGQELQEDKVEAAKKAQEKEQAEFNYKKAEDLKRINEQGKSNNEKKAEAEKQLSMAMVMRTELAQKLDVARKNEEACKTNYSNFVPVVSPDIERLEKELAELEAQANKPDEAAEKHIAELEEKKNENAVKRQEAQAKLNDIEQNRKHQARIRELQEKEAELSDTYGKLKRQEYMCDQYSRTLTDYIDRAITNKFRMAKFVMFKDNITNDGAKECCEVVVNGVPYHDLNNASKMNIGLDIINTLCKHYGVTVPVFIDNAESVTDLIKTDLQIIRLVVSAEDKTLRVEKA